LVGIASGDRRDRISKEFLNRWEAASAALGPGLMGKLKLFATRYGLPKSDYKVFRPYPKDLKPRQQKVGADLYGFIDIKREDSEKTSGAMGLGTTNSLALQCRCLSSLNFRFRRVLGIGCWVVMQNLMLSAHAQVLAPVLKGQCTLGRPREKRFKVPKNQANLRHSPWLPSDDKINKFEAERLGIEQIKLEPND